MLAGAPEQRELAFFGVSELVIHKVGSAGGISKYHEEMQKKQLTAGGRQIGGITVGVPGSSFA